MKRNIKFTSLMMSVVAIIVLFAMLIGSTFAWFTDSVTSSNNIIKSGRLDVEMTWAEGKEDPASANWVDASTGAIFNYDLWEPGFVEVRHIKIENVGNLAFKYKVSIIANGEVSDLSDAIDVYYLDPATQIASRFDLADENKIGNLTTVLSGMATTASGNLIAGENHTITIALMMRENAGNEYQDKSIGTDFSIQLVATQLSYESDDYGNDYDEGASLDYVCVANTSELRGALERQEKNIVLTQNIIVDEIYSVVSETNIDGNGYSIARTNPLSRTVQQPFNGGVFAVAEGETLTLKNITVDGGAIWTGEVNETLGRGTVNSGVQATGALVALGKNSTFILGEGAILQNNCGANAINLGTRIGAKLIIDGGEVLNNYSAAGAIYGGGEIVMNSGKVNYNHGTYGGAVRVVTNCNGADGVFLTMNGGEMNHNYSENVGGALWAGESKSNNVYLFLGGEIAYNESPLGGGAMYAGYYEVVKIGGTFKMHDNKAPLGGAIRFHSQTTFVMTGGEIYNNAGDSEVDSIYIYNTSVSVTGGKIDSVDFSTGKGVVLGDVDIDLARFNLGTNENIVSLAKEFGTIKFTLNTEASNFANFKMKPSTDYVYTQGDEAKLICLIEGYETYWDAEKLAFCLKTVD